MSLVMLIALTVLAGLAFGGLGLVLVLRRPPSRPAAIACWSLAVLLQAWWVLLAALAFFKLVVLRQNT